MMPQGLRGGTRRKMPSPGRREEQVCGRGRGGQEPCWRCALNGPRSWIQAENVHVGANDGQMLFKASA